MLELCGAGGKLIVIHHYVESGRLLVQALSDAGLNPAWIRGGMSPEEVKAQKLRFNEDKSCRVIVGQERAIALGHTLTGAEGDRCSRIAFFENSYSLYFRSQCEDRNHRGDQDEPCTVYDFVTSPIERAAIDSLIAKREMASALDNVVKAVREERGPNAIAMDRHYGRGANVGMG